MRTEEKKTKQNEEPKTWTCTGDYPLGEGGRRMVTETWDHALGAKTQRAKITRRKTDYR